MNRFLLFIFLCITFDATTCIIETEHISDIIAEIEPDTLILFDIDMTSIIPATSLGSSEWSDHLRKKLSRANVRYDRFILHSDKILRQTPHAPVEKITPNLIRLLQDNNYIVWALTGRLKSAPWDATFDLTTKLHLHGSGIDFERTKIPPEIRQHMVEPHPHFSYGIIFSNWTPKGPVLAAFLQELHYIPPKIVMIDDDPDYIQSVEDTMAEVKIPFVGFLYTRAKSLNKRFDPMIANIQLQELCKQGLIISDEEAFQIKNELLKNTPDLSTDFFLDRLIAEQL